MLESVIRCWSMGKTFNTSFPSGQSSLFVIVTLPDQSQSLVADLHEEMKKGYHVLAW